MTPDAELRAAAAHLRETANAAHEKRPDPWKVGCGATVTSGTKYVTGYTTTHGSDVARHIALMSPPVAESIADWLEQHAEEHSVYDCQWEEHACAALATARLILGKSPPVTRSVGTQTITGHVTCADCDWSGWSNQDVSPVAALVLHRAEAHPTNVEERTQRAKAYRKVLARYRRVRAARPPQHSDPGVGEDLRTELEEWGPSLRRANRLLGVDDTPEETQ